MKITIIKHNLLLFALITLLLPNCKKESDNQIINPIITPIIDGLNVMLGGNPVNPNQIFTETKIAWGDGTVNNLSNINFNDFKTEHRYNNPGTYNIILSACNNGKDSISENLSVTVNFRETSLENIKPGLFKTSAKEFLILTVNLHTYQESEQNEKFNLIVDLIGKMGIDFIAFQECAQNKSSIISEGIIREDNPVLIISDRLKEKYNTDYNFVWTWAHYGWDVWEEGIAVLSKHPLTDTDERYISAYSGTGNITSRKAIFGSYQIINGKVNVFSVHTHWRTSLLDEEQNNQIKNIKFMVNEKESLSPNTISFVCGDFNGNPTSDFPWSEGYNTMMGTNDYSDSFLEIYPNADNLPAQSIYNTIGGNFPGRIDYIFMKKNNRFTISESQIIFTNDVVGKVSDHFGVLTKVIDTE